jgi:hypothetical protein
MTTNYALLSKQHRLAARVAAMAFILVTGFLFTSGQAIAQRSDDELIQRFRPFIKTSMGRPGAQSGDESIRPASWQTIVSASVRVQGVPNGQGVAGPGSWTAPYFPELTATFNGKSGDLNQDPANAAQNLLKIPSSISGGEDWQSVALGHGVYGHVQRIDGTTLINIEYWIVWPLNQDEAKFNVHEGDITSLIVLYDTNSDQIVRVTYPAHGCLLAAYQLVPGETVHAASLSGKDPSLNAIQTPALQVNIDDANKGTDRDTGACGGALAPDQHVFLVPDSVSHLYEHPAVYAERGTHESFPNQGGFVAIGGGHNGDSVSYLPQTVDNLGTFASPSGADINFLRFNGLFGSDWPDGSLPDSPKPIVEHREWCWPHALAGPESPGPNMCDASPPGIPEVDINPYERQLDNLTWPPTLNIPQTGDVYVRPGDGNKGATGAMGSPFTDFAVAYSLTPAIAITPASPSVKWTIHVSAGPHPASIIMDRAMTIVSWNGAAAFGSTN